MVVEDFLFIFSHFGRPPLSLSVPRRPVDSPVALSVPFLVSLSPCRFPCWFPMPACPVSTSLSLYFVGEDVSFVII